MVVEENEEEDAGEEEVEVEECSCGVCTDLEDCSKLCCKMTPCMTARPEGMNGFSPYIYYLLFVICQFKKSFSLFDVI